MNLGSEAGVGELSVGGRNNVIVAGINNPAAKHRDTAALIEADRHILGHEIAIHLDAQYVEVGYLSGCAGIRRLYGP